MRLTAQKYINKNGDFSLDVCVKTSTITRGLAYSLATAIGYPDLVSVFMGTTLNQTGQAIEVIAMTMGVYLIISITTSVLMNIYNRRMTLVER